MTLEEFFKDNGKVALAFSGGVDSAFLLYAASHTGADVRAYYVKTPFQPCFELEDAKRLADELGASLRVLEADVLSSPEIAANPPDRCYLCKRIIMGTIREAASADGYALIIDGTNASDDVSDRLCDAVVRALVIPVLDGDRKTRLDVEEVPVPAPRASSAQQSDLSLGKAVRDLLHTHHHKLRSSPISHPPHSAAEPAVDEQNTGRPRLAEHSRPRTPDKNSPRRAQTHVSCRPPQHTDQNKSGHSQKGLWTGSTGYRTRVLPPSARRSTPDTRQQKNLGRCSTGR